MQLNKKNPIGKLQPQAIDFEEAVLGACMLETDAINKVAPILKTECFYYKIHQNIYNAILALKEQQLPIDILTVTNELKSSGQLDSIGGAYYITKLTNRVSSTANIEYHSQIIYQKYCQREVIRIGSEISENSYSDDNDILETIEQAQNNLLSLVKFDTSKISTIDDAIKGVYKIIYHNINHSNQLTGIGTGFKEFDEFTSGIQKGDLVVVAGETSQGKTAFALNIIKNATINFNASCVVYSLEMTKEQLTIRIISSESRINSRAISMHKLSDDSIKQIDAIAQTVLAAKIYFDDSSNSSVDSILNSIRAMKIKYDIDFVVIDYLQLITNNKKGLNKESQVAEIARKLKNIAKEINIAVILLSQLSREKGSPKPTISRLRDSGQIEEAADMIILIYRPEYYGHSLPDPFDNINPINKAFIDIAKGRNTGIKSFLLEFEKETTTFRNCESLDFLEIDNDLNF